MIMAVPIPMFGPDRADKPDMYKNICVPVLETDALFDKLFMSKVNIAPFTDDLKDELIPTMIYLAWWGRCLHLKPDQQVNSDNVLVASWADFMGPKILETGFMTQDEARTALLQAVKILIGPNVVGTFGNAAPLSYDASDEANTADEWANVLTSNGDKNTPDSAMKILKHLATTAIPKFQLGGLSMIIHVYLSLLKGGQIPKWVIDKIQEAANKDNLQISYFKIEKTACSTFFSNFRSTITDDAMWDVTNRWHCLLPETAQCLKSTTISLAAGGGLTSLITIGRAIRIFHDFNWCKVARLYPEEWANVIAAITAVGNNPWYGFRKELSIVASNNYKNVAYVAKELHVKVHRQSKLTRYRGWTRHPEHKVEVDAMIRQYKIIKTLSGVDISDNTEADNLEELERLKKMVVHNSAVYNRNM